VNKIQIDRLAATVPFDLEERQRNRLRVYLATARTCEERVQGLRGELERALRGASAPEDHPDETEAEAVLRIVSELDTLEQMQPRIDGWLKDYVTALSTHATREAGADVETYGDAAPL
jgi:hypothetical protein